MEPTPKTTEASVIADIAIATTKPTLIELAFNETRLPAVSTAKGVTLLSLEGMLPHPLRQSGSTELLSLKDLQAFLAHQASPKAATVVFADKDALLFTAILNFASEDGTPGWGDRRATVKLKKTRHLLRWQGQSGMSKKMGQEAFALFLEENLQDIVDPVASDVLHFAETLEARRTEVFKSSIRTSTGETNLVFSSERDGESSTRLIETFKLGIPLFDGGAPWEIEVKLYHRVAEQKLVFWYEIRHLDYLLDQAWAAEVSFLKEVTAALATTFEGAAPGAQRPMVFSAD